jgi:hypothetical protein
MQIDLDENISLSEYNRTISTMLDDTTCAQGKIEKGKIITKLFIFLDVHLEMYKNYSGFLSRVVNKINELNEDISLSCEKEDVMLFNYAKKNIMKKILTFQY